MSRNVLSVELGKCFASGRLEKCSGSAKRYNLGIVMSAMEEGEEEIGGREERKR